VLAASLSWPYGWQAILRANALEDFFGTAVMVEHVVEAVESLLAAAPDVL